MDEENKQSIPPTEETEDALALCGKQRDEYLDGWKRAKADLLNYKKEEMERLASLMKFGNEALITELLSVLDSFDLGAASLEDKNPAKHGMRMIQGQFLEILKRQGMEPIGVSPGEPFDPSRHEAVGEAAGDGPPGMVVEEVGKGYRLNGKVVRATKVIISKEQNK